MNIPWTQPDFWGNEINYVNKALESTWLSGGTYVNQFENMFQEILKMKHGLAVSNGTTAIHLAFLGLNIQAGDEIIVPGFCFQAAANVALHMGAKPVFAEVDSHSWCLNPLDVERRITSKTKAIVPVHTYGNMCDIDAILQIAGNRNIKVIEDCAESLFSTYKGKQSGTFGHVNTFSFQATKTITTGEGGLVATNDDEIAEKMSLYRSHGMNREKLIYWHELPGHNFRLTNIQAALGVAQLEKREVIIRERKRVYKSFLKRLLGVSGITMQKISANADPLIWALAIKLEPKAFPQGRDSVINHMREAGIETRPGFYASSLLNIYQKHSLPICEGVSKQLISLPCFPTLKDEQIEFICTTLISLRK